MRSCRRNLRSCQKLDRAGNDAETRPVRRAGHMAEREFGGVFGHRLLQRKAPFERARLLRSPGADAATERARIVILVRLGIGNHLDFPPQADLSAQRFPVKTHGCLFLAENFLSLPALEIRVEDKASGIEALEKHHTHIRQTIFVHGGQGNRVGIVRLRGFGILQPGGKQGQGFVLFGEVTSC